MLVKYELFFVMRCISTLIFVLAFSSSGFAEESPECPNRGTDPTKFCLPGEIWDPEIEKCVNLV